MRRLTSAFGGLAALALATGLGLGPAQANGTKPAAAKSAPSWTGCYLGGHAGLVSSSTELGIASTPFSVDGLASKGPAGGVQAGCDYQFNAFVLGIRGEYTFENVDFAINPGLLSASFERSWSMVGRFGVPVHGVLPYVLAGYTAADMSWSITGVSPPNFHGLMLGAGIEMPINANMSFAIEGTWTKFQSETIASTPITLEPEQLAVKALVNVRFGNLLGMK